MTDETNRSSDSDVTLESIRKAVHDARQTMQGQRPPDALFLSTRAFDELMTVRVFPTIMEYESPETPIRYKSPMLYGIPVFRFDTHMPLFRGGVDWAVGPDMTVKRVTWPDVPKETPVPSWYWLVLAGVGALILCLLGGVV